MFSNTLPAVEQRKHYSINDISNNYYYLSTYYTPGFAVCGVQICVIFPLQMKTLKQKCKITCADIISGGTQQCLIKYNNSGTRGMNFLSHYSFPTHQ
jgi:hypothetical protein